MKSLHQFMLNAALAAVMMLSGTAFAAPALSLIPTGPQFAVGSSFDVALNINDVSDLFAYNISLLYNPAIVHFNSVTEGSFLAAHSSTFFIPGIDDPVGTVSFSGASLVGAVTGAAGSGNLLNFAFTGLTAGISPFTLADLLYLDSSFAAIDVPTASAQVQITNGPGESIPEPAGILLMLIGIGSAWSARRMVTRG